MGPLASRVGGTKNQNKLRMAKPPTLRELRIRMFLHVFFFIWIRPCSNGITTIMYTYETRVFIGQIVVRRTWWKYCRALPIPVWRVRLYVHRKNTVVCPYYAHRKSTAVYLYEEYGCMPIWRVYEEYGCMPIWRVRRYTHMKSRTVCPYEYVLEFTFFRFTFYINWCWASVFRGKIAANQAFIGPCRAITSRSRTI